MKVTIQPDARRGIRTLDEQDQVSAHTILETIKSTGLDKSKLTLALGDLGLYQITVGDLRFFVSLNETGDELEVVDLVKPSRIRHLLESGKKKMKSGRPSRSSS